MKQRFFALLAAVLTLSLLLIIPVSAGNASLPRFVDQAGLLSDSDAASLTALLDEISERRQMDVVIITVPNLPDGYYDIMDFADDIYDRAGYGFGTEYDGLLLLLDMGEREWWISTCGYAITAFTDYGLEYLENQFVSYLSAGDFYGGFREFAGECDYLIGLAYDGEPLDYYGGGSYGGDYYEPYREPTLYDGGRLFTSLLFGGIIGLIAVSIVKSAHKSVSFNDSAEQYSVRRLNVTDSRDVFLYKNTSKVSRESTSGSGGSRSGGGSSTHHSSSGRSHGGRGGHF